VAAAIGGGDYQAAHVAVGFGHFGRLVGRLIFGFGFGGWSGIAVSWGLSCGRLVVGKEGNREVGKSERRRVL
jgi:hypothetical protein